MGRSSGFVFVDGDAGRGLKPAQARHWGVAVVAVIVAQWVLWQSYSLAAFAQGMAGIGLAGMFIDGPIAVLGGTVIAALLTIAACLYYLRCSDGRTLRDIGITWAKLPLFALWLCLGVVAAAPVILEIFASSGVDWRAFMRGAAVTSSVTVLQASGEEVLFRGLILPILVAQYGVRAGVLLSAALFGAWHIGTDHVLFDTPITVLTTAVFGVTAAILTLHTGSLLPAIALHLVWNVAGELGDVIPHMTLSQEFWAAWAQMAPVSFTMDPTLYARTVLVPLAIETLLILAMCRDTAVRVFVRK